jgi:flagellar motility protein MotE (MotC chaperone)
MKDTAEYWKDAGIRIMEEGRKFKQNGIEQENKEKMTQEEKIQAFYKWLEEHEHLFEQEHDKDSARLVASIKSMYKYIFDL